MPRQKIKPRKTRNWLAVHVHNKTSAGPMDKKGRQKQKKYDKLREDLEEALDILKEIEKDES